MAGDEDHTVTDQLLRGGDRLLGIAEVIHGDQLHLLAEHAAGGVEVGYSLLRTALHLLAEPSILSRNRARHSDQDFRPAGRRARRQT